MSSNNVYIGGGFSPNNSATTIKLYTANNTTTTTGSERMRINNVGNVGIGTTSPIDKLDINGSITIRDTGSTRGIRRDNDAYDLRLMGGTSLTDGAYISLSGDIRGGVGNAIAGKVEIAQGGQLHMQLDPLYQVAWLLMPCQNRYRHDNRGVYR